jgi:hypothetical protein
MSIYLNLTTANHVNKYMEVKEYAHVPKLHGLQNHIQRCAQCSFHFHRWHLEQTLHKRQTSGIAISASELESYDIEDIRAMNWNGISLRYRCDRLDLFRLSKWCMGSSQTI